MKVKFKIEGLDCANCARELEEEILKIENISNVNINFLMQKMEVECTSDSEDIISNIKKVIKKNEPDVTIERI